MRKIIIILTVITFGQVCAFGSIYNVPVTIHAEPKSQHLSQELQSNVQASNISLAPVLEAKTSLSVSQIGVIPAITTNAPNELSQDGILHTIVNSNYAHVSKTFEIDILT